MQRYEYGAIAGTSQISTRGAGQLRRRSGCAAANADGDTEHPGSRPCRPASLCPPAARSTSPRSSRTHELITPFDKFGVNVPKTLYSIAYF